MRRSTPSPPTGGDDPESLDRARLNAPLTVLTLDRIVSLRDYEDFARAFAGIAKALATWTWDGERQGVFVTVAGVDGTPLAENGERTRIWLRRCTTRAIRMYRCA